MQRRGLHGEHLAVLAAHLPPTAGFDPLHHVGNATVELGLGREVAGTYLEVQMRDAIRGHQRPSEFIRGHQWSSAAIRGHQRSSEVISGHQRPSAHLLEEPP
jgi:hypothetical protein